MKRITLPHATRRPMSCVHTCMACMHTRVRAHDICYTHASFKNRQTTSHHATPHQIMRHNAATRGITLRDITDMHKRDYVHGNTHA